MSHANARLTPAGRPLLVRRVAAGAVSRRVAGLGRGRRG